MTSRPPSVHVSQTSYVRTTGLTLTVVDITDLFITDISHTTTEGMVDAGLLEVEREKKQETPINPYRFWHAHRGEWRAHGHVHAQ